MHYKRISVLVALPLLGIAGFALVSSKANSAKSTVIRNDSVAVSTGQASSNNNRKAFRSGRLLPELHFALKALGDRLEQPGKERVILSGVLQRTNERQPIPFTMIAELPGRLRLTMQQGINQRFLVFDGQRAASSDGALNQNDLAMLETLVYDTPDRFLLGQMHETSPRFLGSHFRADDGTTGDYQGPFYDVYQATESIKTDPSLRRQGKLYYFNSATQLLERVRYTEMRSGTAVGVEVQIADWRPGQNQQVARRITRLENNAPVLTLTLASVLFVPQAQDGIFSPP